MFDCHCDFLTYVYINRNDKRKINNTYKLIYNNNNVRGAIFNLFFMSEKEMKDELNINKTEIDIINMLKIVNKLLKNIDKNRYIYGIEGLDYLNNISDIDLLYDLGVRSTNIVWNNKNKFGAGSRINNKYGLTNIGEELVEKLIRKNILIDLSHTNETTFFDIIEKSKQMRKRGYKPKVFASHSNVKKICDVKRNLSDEQLIAIKEMNGLVGIVEYKDFVMSEKWRYEDYYLKHINYLKRLFDGTENIAVSSDDERYYNLDLKNANIYKLETIRERHREFIIK